MLSAKVWLVCWTSLPGIPRPKRIRRAPFLGHQPFRCTDDHELMLNLIQILICFTTHLLQDSYAGFDVTNGSCDDSLNGPQESLDVRKNFDSCVSKGAKIIHYLR